MTDTTTEAVERLAVAADEVFADLPYLLGRAATDGHAIAKSLSAMTRPKLEHTAATLRAVAAERDAAVLARAEAIVALNNRDRERMQAEREARKAEAERDALRAAADNAAGVLRDAGKQFDFYAGEHAKKDTSDGNAKAGVNLAWADRCLAAYHTTAKSLRNDR